MTFILTAYQMLAMKESDEMVARPASAMGDLENAMKRVEILDGFNVKSSTRRASMYPDAAIYPNLIDNPSAHSSKYLMLATSEYLQPDVILPRNIWMACGEKLNPTPSRAYLEAAEKAYGRVHGNVKSGYDNGVLLARGAGFIRYAARSFLSMYLGLQYDARRKKGGLGIDCFIG